MNKKMLGINVLEEAKKRISWSFDTFENIYISFSGGKDSTVMMHLVMEEAIKRKRKIGCLFIDWEAQYKLTIDLIQDMIEKYKEHLDIYWICLPFLTTNATSMIEPEWICWEKGKEEIWVRELPKECISDYNYFPFYKYGMTFEEFIVEFGLWYGKDKLTGCFIGIRCVESFNRFRTIFRDKSCYDGKKYTTLIGDNVYNLYPIYDWRTEDIWVYNAKFKKIYNKLYDMMFQAGLTIHQMRVCEPYGDEQRKNIWLFHIIEPLTWGKVVARVNGANTGSLYAKDSGNIMGNMKVTKPENHTWKSFAKLLLDTMPIKTREHYKNKFAVYLKWYSTRGYANDIPDLLPNDTGQEDNPSWRRICKVLLKNDYWCSLLCFSPQKSSAYERYQKIMKKRRDIWKII